MTWIIRPRSKVGNLSAIVEGAGPLVVLLHGVGLRAEACSSQVDALVASGFRVIAPDMPGHGLSPFTPETKTLDDYTDLVVECCDETCVVVGHSMGAMIALNLAVRYPDQVSGVAALNAVFGRSEAAKAAISQRVQTLDGIANPSPEGTLSRWFGDVSSPQRSACEEWLREVNPAGYKAAYSVFAQEDGPRSNQLTQLDNPAAFITGSDEPNSTPEMSKQMTSLAVNGAAHIIEGAAHMMPMTHTNAVNRIIVDFAKACLV